MKCSEFQKLIPDIVNNTVPDEYISEVLEHVGECKDCYDELEIHYILRYGLSDDEDEKAVDFIGQLESNLENMKNRQKRFDIHHSVFALIQLTSYTAIIGSFIYVLFKFFL